MCHSSVLSYTTRPRRPRSRLRAFHSTTSSLTSSAPFVTTSRVTKRRFSSSMLTAVNLTLFFILLQCHVMGALSGDWLAEGQGQDRVWPSPSSSKRVAYSRTNNVDDTLLSDDNDSIDNTGQLKYNIKVANRRIARVDSTGDAEDGDDEDVILTSEADGDEEVTTVATSALPQLFSAPTAINVRKGGKGRKSGTNRRKATENALRTQTSAADGREMAFERRMITSYSPMGKQQVTSSSAVEEQLCDWKSWKKPTANSPAGLKTIYMGGLFELTGDVRPGYGCTELAAAYLALQHVNEQRVIPGYQLDIRHNDTRCDAGYGAAAFYHLVYDQQPIVMLLATSCTNVAMTLGEIVQYWNLLLISHATESPLLSDREKYPTFLRMLITDMSHNAVRVALIRHFNWTRVAILYEDTERHSLAISDMVKILENEGIYVETSSSFRSKEEIKTRINDFHERDLRVIIGNFNETMAKTVFCQAYQQGMYGGRYVWMLQGKYANEWWRTVTPSDDGCWPDEVALAADGYFSVRPMGAPMAHETAQSRLNKSEFEHHVHNMVPSADVISPHAVDAYDTVWAMALTLRNVSARQSPDTLAAFQYKPQPIGWEYLQATMSDLRFVGVSGHIYFKDRERQGVAIVTQNQGGKQHQVGLFQPSDMVLALNCSQCYKIIFKGGKIPADRNRTLTRSQHIHPTVVIAVMALCDVGATLAVAFLAFNIWFRKIRYIKLSSPKLNNAALVGCLLVYLGVALLAIDDLVYIELDSAFSSICALRAFLFAAGFSLTFGAMFAKTFRVHRILKQAHGALVRSKLLKDKHLLCLIGGLLMIDVIIICLWIIFDPMKKSIHNLTLEMSPDDPDLWYVPQVSQCRSEQMSVWTGALYAYKGLLLLFGVYMAWETRHVKIPVLNDSHQIGISIYNVVLCSGTVVALSSLLQQRPTLAYCVVSILVFISTTSLQLFLFLPKIYALRRHKGSPVVASAGLSVEGNTRRFHVDERKELSYRAEVQNRVYKREIATLDENIARLIHMLEEPPPPAKVPPVPAFRYCDVTVVQPDTAEHATSVCVRQRRCDKERNQKRPGSIDSALSTKPSSDAAGDVEAGSTKCQLSSDSTLASAAARIAPAIVFPASATIHGHVALLTSSSSVRRRQSECVLGASGNKLGPSNAGGFFGGLRRLLPVRNAIGGSGSVVRAASSAQLSEANRTAGSATSDEAMPMSQPSTNRRCSSSCLKDGCGGGQYSDTALSATPPSPLASSLAAAAIATSPVIRVTEVFADETTPVQVSYRDNNMCHGVAYEPPTISTWIENSETDHAEHDDEDEDNMKVTYV